MILKTLGGGDRLVRDASLGAVLAAEGLTRGGNGSSTTVTGRSMLGLPAAKEAIRIASEAVANTRFGVFRGGELDRVPVVSTWQAKFFRSVPNERESWPDVFEQTEASLTGRNNAYWLKSKADDGRVALVYVAHPDNVEARWNSGKRAPEYRVRRDGSNSWSEWVGGDVVLHFRKGYLEPGCIVSPSPLQLHRDTLRAALAKIQYEAGYYDDGLMQQLGVEFPASVTREQAERFKDLMQAEMSVGNRGRMKIVGGGAKLTTIGLSLEDSQYVESMQLSLEQQALIFGVTASLIGGGRGSGDKGGPLSPEHEETRWHRYGLGPRLNRISSTINADADFFGGNGRDYGMFAGLLVRGDVATESKALVSEVQAGILLPDEARARRGLPPLPDGLGQIPQITPVGGAPNSVPDDDTAP